MGKVVERKKKKKKGRPSLLDLQKRTIREQEDHHHHQPLHHRQPPQPLHHKKPTPAPHSAPIYKSATPTPPPLRRSTRRNPNADETSPDEILNDEDDDELAGKRREKKLKLVLRLPSQKSSRDSGSLNSCASDSNAEDDNAASNHKKRKINAIGDGSGISNSVKVEKSISSTNPAKSHQGTQLDSGPSTPLPDKKLLLFILDRLQKKDTYGVFSEPVDPRELPDYHEVIEHPMDFATVRKKVSGGAYANLEQFEKDIFLICSNAMQYNAPDTIYFRQARSIHELASKNFENLRQDSDDNEPEPKIVRRGRPPTKHFKKPLGRPSLDRVASEFSSDATLATGAENSVRSNHDLRKGPFPDKSGFADSSGRFHGSRNDVYTGLSTENKHERTDEGSMLKSYSVKHGKKQFVLDENRRNTYKQFHQSAGGRGPSVLTTFDGERKQLMAVGLLSEHGYARSLARFAANVGPVAWTLASKRIERSLPAEVKFGPGWVGENDVAPQRPLLLRAPHPGQSLSSLPFSVPERSNSTATRCTVESNGDKSSEKPEGDNLSEKHAHSVHSTVDGHLSKPLPSSATTSSSLFVANKSPEPRTERAEAEDGLNPHRVFNMVNNSVIRARPPFQFHQNPVIHPGMNGFNGTYGFNLPAQTGKLIGPARPPGFNFESSQMLDTISRTNTNSVHPVTANNLNSEDSKFSENSSMISSGGPRFGHHLRPSWRGLSPRQKSESGLSPQQKPDLGPPDLNIRFQSPGSPSSSRVDSTQPDLALQL